MGYKSTFRKINSTINKIDRESKRQARAHERESIRKARELEKQRKEIEKMEELVAAMVEVEEYENYIAQIQSIHTEPLEFIDWEKIRDAPAPVPPKNRKNNELLVREKLDKFSPNIFHKVFNLTKWRINQLKNKVDLAIERDCNVFIEKEKEFESKMKEWESENELSNLLLSGHQETLVNALVKFSQIEEIEDYGSSIEFEFNDNGNFTVTFNALGPSIVPNESKSLLKSGKLSVKKLPRSKYYEIYQDYVCSAAIRLAREVFSSIPLDLVRVNAVDDLLNKKTGHTQPSCILSVLFSRSTLQNLNIKKIDPSDSMDNFIHNMNFKKTTGFLEVDEVLFCAVV